MAAWRQLGAASISRAHRRGGSSPKCGTARGRCSVGGCVQVQEDREEQREVWEAEGIQGLAVREGHRLGEFGLSGSHDERLCGQSRDG
jgi:hypothetical protein